MDVDPVDFLHPCRCLNSQMTRRQESCSNTCINLTAVLISVIICLSGMYYYEIAGRNYLESWSKLHYDEPEYKAPDQRDSLADFRKEIQHLKEKIDQTDVWREHLEQLYTKIYHSQESTFQKKLNEALDVYDSDKIGLFDYAASYARGSVHSIPDTVPYPINKTLTFFNLVNINVLSNPENLLRPGNLPGSCFAFAGHRGRVRLKLGKRIMVRAVSVDHVRVHADRSSAPKEFEVYGLENPDSEDSGALLGTFRYDIEGRPVQTFPVDGHTGYEYVELRVLSNHGKKEFTCVYRFRVHDVFIKN
ncbi:unnamed protein product [Phyllotreta striolata]|uniref:SUN domain-containing protein n=1 Tax=Phyllotreta striolata TaxID=444603 RepID=A0A9N9TI41_PHYSR|nr:unnamed protein product [Phyllotreta striolata]